MGFADAVIQIADGFRFRRKNVPPGYYEANFNKNAGPQAQRHMQQRPLGVLETCEDGFAAKKPGVVFDPLDPVDTVEIQQPFYKRAGGEAHY